MAGRQRPPRGGVGRPGGDLAAQPGDAEAPSSAPDPNAILIEALDRLRATAALCPVEVELVRALRGARHYQEESRHGLPIISDPEVPPAPAGPGADPPGQG